MFAAEFQTGWFLENAWLIPVIPGIAFFVIILFGKRLPMKGSEVAPDLDGRVARARRSAPPYQWIQRTDAAAGDARAPGPFGIAAGFARSIAASEGGARRAVRPARHQVVDVVAERRLRAVTIGQHIDGLSVMLLLLVTFISLLVQVFSLEYVRGDRRYTHFFAAMTLFSAGMLVMVLAENMVQVILGWEIMGLCSFMLIGHWWEEEPNARAALKAFFTVRVGDIGLLVGTSMLFFGANSWIAGAPRSQRLQHRGHLRPGRCPARPATPCCCGAPSPCSRLHRQERPVPAAHLVARRDGRPDAGLVAAALLDDGRGRRVPRRPPLPGVLGGLLDPRRATSTSSS